MPTRAGWPRRTGSRSPRARSSATAATPATRPDPTSTSRPGSTATPRTRGSTSRNLTPVSFKLVIVGGGKMGDALLGGLLASGWAAAQELAVVEKLPARRDELVASRPGVTVAADPVPAAGALLAVKPGDVEAAGRALAAAGVPRVLSIAAGVRLADLERALGDDVAVVRAMPNTPAL